MTTKRPKKRRPTAEDRSIVDWLKAMKPGKWHIEVEGPPQGVLRPQEMLGMAGLKREVSMTMRFGNTTVTIYPEIDYDAWKKGIEPPKPYDEDAPLLPDPLPPRNSLP